jgi:polar amino acid transport system substrate-binding protein
VSRGTRLKAFALLPAFALAGMTMACGAGGNGSGGTSPSTPAAAGGTSAGAIPVEAKDDKLAALVPDAIKSDGKIVVGQDQSYAPNEFVDNGKAVGFDVDLGTAIGQKLGLQMEFQNADFSGIIAGLAASKYELAMSSFTINKDRLATVDMVSYYKAGSSMAVLKGNPDNLSLDNLCGKTVAVQKGTTQADDVQAKSKTCTDAGKPAIVASQLTAQTDVNLALTAKRAQAMLADSPVIDYAITQTNGALQAVGDPYDSAPYGIAIKKGQGTYDQAVQGAVQALIDDGTFKKILDKWKLNPVGVIAKSEINPAPAS